MISSFTFWCLFASTTTSSAVKIQAASKVGQKLLENAWQVVGEEETTFEDNRRVAENQADDRSWIAEMSLKFDSCYNTIALGEENGNGGTRLEHQALVTFQFCSSECQECQGGIYAMKLSEFVDAYTEERMAEDEYMCEMSREECNCDDSEDAELCAYNCWNDLGMNCSQTENNDGQNAFEVQAYLECGNMEVNNNNNGYANNGYANEKNGLQVYKYWDGTYRVGPYCAADGKSIYLGVFYDEVCTISAGDGVYASMNHVQLPYSVDSNTGPLVPLDSCVSCLDQQQQKQGDYYNYENGDESAASGMEPLEFCTTVWQDAVKCNSYNNYGCRYINEFLKNLNRNKIVRYVGAPDNNVPFVFATIFGVFSIVFAAYSFYLFRLIKRGEVELVQEAY